MVRREFVEAIHRKDVTLASCHQGRGPSKVAVDVDMVSWKVGSMSRVRQTTFPASQPCVPMEWVVVVVVGRRREVGMLH